MIVITETAAISKYFGGISIQLNYADCHIYGILLASDCMGSRCKCKIQYHFESEISQDDFIYSNWLN